MGGVTGFEGYVHQWVKGFKGSIQQCATYNVSRDPSTHWRRKRFQWIHPPMGEVKCFKGSIHKWATYNVSTDPSTNGRRWRFQGIHPLMCDVGGFNGSIHQWATYKVTRDTSINGRRTIFQRTDLPILIGGILCRFVLTSEDLL